MADATSSAWPRALVPAAIAAAGVAAGMGAAAFNLAHQGFPDFEVFWTAARHAGDPLLYNSDYLTALQTWEPGTGPRPFVYPPTFLLMIWPFGLLPFLPAYYLWAGLSVAAIGLAAWRLVTPGWGAVLVVVTFPVLMAAAYGQSVLFAGAALVAGATLLERRPRLGGALIALAACIKPQLTLLSPLLLLGHWSAMRAAIVAGLALVLASFVFGAGRWLEWLGAVAEFSRTVHQLPLHFINPLSPDLNLAEKAAVVAGGLGFAAWSLRRSVAERLVGVVAGSLCCTLYAVRPDIAILAPSGLVWVLDGRGGGSGWMRRLAGLALLGGLVVTPFGVVAFMLAVALAELPIWNRLLPPSAPPARAASNGG
ncbi:MAG TPA: glycosyltransferase family 87 protein [Caulobacteraceae bacterium]|jgi:hypothetical protein|nr:glycosyltransferase family 87 protein [Caulobacteraceae bacterium]